MINGGSGINVLVTANASAVSQSINNELRRAQALAANTPIKIKIDTRGVKEATHQFNLFSASLEKSANIVASFATASAIIFGVQRALQSMVSTAIEVEKELKDIDVILNSTSDSFQKFSSDLFQVAKDTGQAFKVVADAAAEFARQGLSLEDTLTRTRDALILTRLTGLDAESAVKSLTAAVNTFKQESLSTTDVVNRLANVDAAFAVSSQDLVEALARVGATAQDAKAQFNELAAVTTSLQQTTARGGAVIGNALKSIFTRLQRQSTVDALEKLNVQVRDVEGNTLPAIDVIKNLAQVYQTLGDRQKAQISETVAGVYQINILKALLNDLSGSTSIYEQALEKANTTTDEAIRRNELLNQTMAALINETKASFGELSTALVGVTAEPTIRKLLDSMNGLFEGLTKVADGTGGVGSVIGQSILKGLGDVLSGPGIAVIGALFLKIFGEISKSLFKTFQNFASVTKEQGKIANLQNTINGLLDRGNSNVLQLLQNTSNRAKQEEIIISALRAENALITQQNALRNQLTNMVVGRGGKSVSGKGTIAVADGYLPVDREIESIRKGVGGASRSAKPVVLRNFNFGKTKGTVVANTDEYRVDKYMGGSGSAIFNRDMIRSMGGPNALKAYGEVSKVSAGGYVPNMAVPPRIGMLNTPKGISMSHLQDLLIEGKRRGLPYVNAGLKRPADLIGAGVEATVVGRKRAVIKLQDPNVKFQSPEQRVKTAKDFNSGADAFMVPLQIPKTKASTVFGQKVVVQERVNGITLDSFIRRKYKDLDKVQRQELIRATEDSLASLKPMLSLFSPGAARNFDQNSFNFMVNKKDRDAVSAILDKYVQNPNGLRNNFVSDLYGKNVKLSAIDLASGFIPNMAKNPLAGAIGREISSLTALGLSPLRATESIRVDSSPRLTTPQNPLGLGVFNTAQGQTSIGKAISDHSGQNVAQAGGIPSMANDQFKIAKNGRIYMKTPGGGVQYLSYEQLKNIDPITARKLQGQFPQASQAFRSLGQGIADQTASSPYRAVATGKTQQGLGIRGFGGSFVNPKSLSTPNLLDVRKQTESIFGKVSNQFKIIDKEVGRRAKAAGFKTTDQFAKKYFSNREKESAKLAQTQSERFRAGQVVSINPDLERRRSERRVVERMAQGYNRPAAERLSRFSLQDLQGRKAMADAIRKERAEYKAQQLAKEAAKQQAQQAKEAAKQATQQSRAAAQAQRDADKAAKRQQQADLKAQKEARIQLIQRQKEAAARAAMVDADRQARIAQQRENDQRYTQKGQIGYINALSKTKFLTEKSAKRIFGDKLAYGGVDKSFAKQAFSEERERRNAVNRQRAMGLSFGLPFINGAIQNAFGEKEQQSSTSRAVSGALGGAAGVTSIAAILGLANPLGLAGVALGGAVVGAVNSLDDAALSFKKIAKEAEDLNSNNQQTINSTNAYIASMAELNDLIAQGAKPDQIKAAREKIDSNLGAIPDSETYRKLSKIDTSLSFDDQQIERQKVLSEFQKKSAQEESSTAVSVKVAQLLSSEGKLAGLARQAGSGSDLTPGFKELEGIARDIVGSVPESVLKNITPEQLKQLKSRPSSSVSDINSVVGLGVNTESLRVLSDDLGVNQSMALGQLVTRLLELEVVSSQASDTFVTQTSAIINLNEAVKRFLLETSNKEFVRQAEESKGLAVQQTRLSGFLDRASLTNGAALEAQSIQEGLARNIGRNTELNEVKNSVFGKLSELSAGATSQENRKTLLASIERLQKPGSNIVEEFKLLQQEFALGDSQFGDTVSSELSSLQRTAAEINLKFEQAEAVAREELEQSKLTARNTALLSLFNVGALTSGLSEEVTKGLQSQFAKSDPRVTKNETERLRVAGLLGGNLGRSRESASQVISQGQRAQEIANGILAAGPLVRAEDISPANRDRLGPVAENLANNQRNLLEKSIVDAGKAGLITQGRETLGVFSQNFKPNTQNEEFIVKKIEEAINGGDFSSASLLSDRLSSLQSNKPNGLARREQISTFQNQIKQLGLKGSLLGESARLVAGDKIKYGNIDANTQAVVDQLSKMVGEQTSTITAIQELGKSLITNGFLKIEDAINQITLKQELESIATKSNTLQNESDSTLRDREFQSNEISKRELLINQLKKAGIFENFSGGERGKNQLLTDIRGGERSQSIGEMLEFYLGKGTRLNTQAQTILGESDISTTKFTPDPKLFSAKTDSRLAEIKKEQATLSERENKINSGLQEKSINNTFANRLSGVLGSPGYTKYLEETKNSTESASVLDKLTPAIESLISTLKPLEQKDSTVTAQQVENSIKSQIDVNIREAKGPNSPGGSSFTTEELSRFEKDIRFFVEVWVSEFFKANNGGKQPIIPPSSK